MSSDPRKWTRPTLACKAAGMSASELKVGCWKLKDDSYCSWVIVSRNQLYINLLTEYVAKRWLQASKPVKSAGRNNPSPLAGNLDSSIGIWAYMDHDDVQIFADVK